MKTLKDFDVRMESLKASHENEVRESYKLGVARGIDELEKLATMTVKTTEGRAMIAYIGGAVRNLREGI